jgi:hypothetical protein
VRVKGIVRYSGGGRGGIGWDIGGRGEVLEEVGEDLGAVGVMGKPGGDAVEFVEIIGAELVKEEVAVGEFAALVGESGLPDVGGNGMEVAMEVEGAECGPLGGVEPDSAAGVAFVDAAGEVDGDGVVVHEAGAGGAEFEGAGIGKRGKGGDAGGRGKLGGRGGARRRGSRGDGGGIGGSEGEVAEVALGGEPVAEAGGAAVGVEFGLEVFRLEGGGFTGGAEQGHGGPPLMGVHKEDRRGLGEESAGRRSRGAGQCGARVASNRNIFAAYYEGESR